MIKKLLYLIVVIVFYSCITDLKSQSLQGTYFVGDDKVTISADENTYYVSREGSELKSRLQYEENTPENDQIWLEWQKGNQTGTYVLKSDYSSGIYTDYRTLKESYVKKIE